MHQNKLCTSKMEVMNKNSDRKLQVLLYQSTSVIITVCLLKGNTYKLKLQMRITRSIWTRAHFALAKNTQLKSQWPISLC